jgi:hypothetical protein
MNTSSVLALKIETPKQKLFRTVECEFVLYVHTVGVFSIRGDDFLHSPCYKFYVKFLRLAKW